MKTKDIKTTIKEYFFVYPSVKLRVREIERTLNLPLPSVIRYCKELEQEGILEINKIGSVTYYTSSRNEEYFLEKKIYNLKQLYNSGLVQFLKIELSNQAIVIFGSYAKGEDLENSDIDLYIETPSKKQVNLDKFKKILKREIQLFQNKSLKDLANPHLANNVINGITLNSYIEVFK